MNNLRRPGDERAGDLFSDEAFLAAMVAVEEALLDVRSEQRAMADLAEVPPTAEYLGATDAMLEAPLARAAGVPA